MYLEEKIINGVLHFRTSPDAPFEPVSARELSSRLKTAEARLSEVATITHDDLMDATVSLIDGVITMAFGDDEIAARVFDAVTLQNGGKDNG